MAAQFFIQGIDFTDVTDGLDDLVITYSMEDSKLMGVSVSNELRLTGEGHNYLHGVFFSNPCIGRFSRLAATIVPDCCDYETSLDFTIDYEGVQSSDLDCETIVNLKAKNNLQVCYEYLRDTPYFYSGDNENGFEQAYNSPKVHYQIQRKNFFVILALFQLLYPALFLLDAIEAVINAILNFINAIIRWLPIPAIPQRIISGFLEAGINLPSLDDYLAYLTGSGNYHFAPYVKDIFDHNITQANSAGGCTMTLDFELLDQAPYSELSLFQAFAKGYNYKSRSSERFNTKAAYNRTLIQFLEEIEEVFRLKSGITPSGDFIIATENRFHEKAVKIFNAEQKFLTGEAEEAPEYKFIQNQLFRVSNISYSEDPSDEESKYKIYPEYSEKKIWAQALPGSDKLEKTFKFGPARFMYDTETKESDSWYDDDKQRDDIRSGKPILRSLILFYPLVWDGVGNLPRHNDLILSSHTTDFPKLLVLEPGTDVSDAQTIKRTIPDGLNTYFHYNYPMHLEYDAEYQELMKRFHEVDSPFSKEQRIIEMNDFEVALTTPMINSISSNGLFVGIESKYGKATPEQIEIKLKNCTAVFKGLKYKCPEF